MKRIIFLFAILSDPQLLPAKTITKILNCRKQEWLLIMPVPETAEL